MTEYPLRRRTVLKGSLAAAMAAVGVPATAGASEHQPRSFVVEQEDRLFCVTALSTGETVDEFYNYISPHSHTTTDVERSDVSNLFLFEGPDGTSLVTIHDKANDDHTHGSDTGGGAVTFYMTGLPTAEGQWVVRDDGEISPTDTSPDWSWVTQHTDGGAWRGGLDGDFEITIDPAFNEDAERRPLGNREGSLGEDVIDEWHFLSGDASDPDRTKLDMDKPVSIHPGDCAPLDIKPCSDPNAINPDSGGVIPVAIPHGELFDPVKHVDVNSLRFGAPDVVDGGDGAGAAHNGHTEDVVPCEGDGRDDLVVHFPTEDTGFDGDETHGKLVGETTDGTPIVGTDSVKLVGGNGQGGPP
jgi:hypothetical protein